MKLGIYKHFKGKLYRVYFVARHSETLEEFVVYQTLYDNFDFWVRPKSMFEEQVMKDGVLVPRFEYISD